MKTIEIKLKHKASTQFEFLMSKHGLQDLLKGAISLDLGYVKVYSFRDLDIDQIDWIEWVSYKARKITNQL